MQKLMGISGFGRKVKQFDINEMIQAARKNAPRAEVDTAAIGKESDEEEEEDEEDVIGCRLRVENVCRFISAVRFHVGPTSLV